MTIEKNQSDLLLTFNEAMSYLRVSRSTLYRLIGSGQISGHKVGNTWRFSHEEVLSCIKRMDADGASFADSPPL